jgi:hypothetical protein
MGWFRRFWDVLVEARDSVEARKDDAADVGWRMFISWLGKVRHMMSHRLQTLYVAFRLVLYGAYVNVNFLEFYLRQFSIFLTSETCSQKEKKKGERLFPSASISDSTRMRESGRAPFFSPPNLFSVVRDCTAVHRCAPPCTVAPPIGTTQKNGEKGGR